MALSFGIYPWDCATLTHWLEQSGSFCLGINQVCSCFSEVLAAS